MNFLTKCLKVLNFRNPKEGDSVPESNAHTTASEAESIATNIAKSKKYSWKPPITTNLIFHNGKPHWCVRCNAGQRGNQMLVVINDETQEVVEVQTQPR